MDKNSYQAKVGCWNCDFTYKILVRKGVVTPQHLQDKELKCVNCGCDSLRPYEDYKINKKIMKDLVLQHRLEESFNNSDQIEKQHDHYT